MATTLLTVSSPTPKHDPGLRREGLAQGRNMPAQIARTGVLSGRSKRKKRRAAGDLGQDPGEMATAGAQPALVRWGPEECCKRWREWAERTYSAEAPMAKQRELKVCWSGLGWRTDLEIPRVLWAAIESSLWLDQDTDSPPTFLAQMVAPALLAGGNMGTGVASLSLICEGIEEDVVKRRGGVVGAALTSGGAEGLKALMMTRMGSQSGA